MLIFLLSKWDGREVGRSKGGGAGWWIRWKGVGGCSGVMYVISMMVMVWYVFLYGLL